MYHYYIFYISLFFNISYAEFNITDLDKYHDELSHWLVSTSNYIDDYLIESNSTKSSKTYAELKTSFAIENRQNIEYAIRLKLRLDLPKIKKELRIVFEDDTSDDSLYDSTTLDSDYHLEERSYFVRLEYFRYIKEYLSLSSGGGVRFRKSSLHPYINFKIKYKIKDETTKKIIMKNRFRYYINEDIENILSFTRDYTLSESLSYTFSNTLRYRNWEDYKKIINKAYFFKKLKDEEWVRVGASLNSRWMDTSIRANYYQLYGSYRNLLYKNWIYYELTPSILRREDNNFNNSYRFMVNFGAIFKKH